MDTLLAVLTFKYFTIMCIIGFDNLFTNFLINIFFKNS